MCSFSVGPDNDIRNTGYNRVVDFIKTVNMDQRKSETRGMKVPYQIDKAKIRGANYNSSIQQLLTGMVKKFPEAIFKALQKELKKGSCRLK